MIDSIVFTWALPLIFILHNMEEYIYYDQFSEKFSKLAVMELNNRIIFLYAILILSLFVTVVLFVNYFYQSKISHFLVIIVFLAIFINGLQHCLDSLLEKRVLPGTVTSALFIIPFSLYALIKVKGEIFTRIEDILTYIIAALLMMHFAILISLWCGFFINKFFNNNDEE